MCKRNTNGDLIPSVLVIQWYGRCKLILRIKKFTVTSFFLNKRRADVFERLSKLFYINTFLTV
jgi:hypothetical protein